MRKTVLVLAAFLCAPALSRAASADTHRIAVVVVGPDAGIAAELQRDLEIRLAATPRITVRGANDLAPALGRGGPAPAPATVDPPLRKSADELLQKASDAYYDDRAAAALDKLDALTALEEKTPGFGATDRVRLLLWRTAVYLAMKDTAHADAEALAALTLDPELTVDLNEFRPSVKEMVDKVRARGLHLVTVVLNGLPAGASVRVDDRTVGARFQVAVGRHRLVAWAPGRREVARPFEAMGDLSISTVLPLALEPALESTLTGIAAHGGAGPQDASALAALAARTGADWLVLGATKSEPAAESRVVLCSLTPGGPAFASAVLPSGPAANAALASWADGRLQSDVAVAPVAPIATPASTPVAMASPRETPRALPRPRPVRRAPDEETSGLALVARPGVVWNDHVRRASGGGSYSVGFGGFGPRVSVDATRRALFGEIDASYVTYGMSSLDVRDGSTTSRVKGGSLLTARLGGGWRHAFGGDPDAAPSIRAGGGLVYESMSSEDVKDASGAPLYLLPSWTRTALELRADGRLPFAGAPLAPAVFAGLAISPVGTFAESPPGASGSSPSMGPGADWRLGVSFTPAARASIDVEYDGAMRETGFKGAAKSARVPLTNETVTDTFHGFAASLRLRF